MEVVSGQAQVTIAEKQFFYTKKKAGREKWSMGVRCPGNNSTSVSSVFKTSEKVSNRSKIDSLDDENELFIDRTAPKKWSRRVFYNGVTQIDSFFIGFPYIIW